MLIHCNDLTDNAWRMIADAGVNVSLCPTSDTQLGIVDALPPIQKAIEFGVPVGLSVDVECSLGTDMFAQMQSIFTTQRMWAYHRRYPARSDAPAPLSVRAVLEMATVDGARTNGVLDRSGVLSVGRQADIVMLNAEAINTMPLNNAISTAVLGAHSATSSPSSSAARSGSGTVSSSDRIGADTSPGPRVARSPGGRHRLSAGCRERDTPDHRPGLTLPGRQGGPGRRRPGGGSAPGDHRDHEVRIPVATGVKRDRRTEDIVRSVEIPVVLERRQRRSS